MLGLFSFLLNVGSKKGAESPLSGIGGLLKLVGRVDLIVTR